MKYVCNSREWRHVWGWAPESSRRSHFTLLMCLCAQLLIWGGMLLVASSVVLLQAPSDTTTSAVVSVAVWMATFPLALILEVGPIPPQVSALAQPDTPDAFRMLQACVQTCFTATSLASPYSYILLLCEAVVVQEPPPPPPPPPVTASITVKRR